MKELTKGHTENHYQAKAKPLISLIPISSPDCWSKTCKCPLSMPPSLDQILPHLYPAQKGEFVLLQGKRCIMAEPGKSDVAVQEM